MSQDPVDDVLILNASDDFDVPATATTNFHIDIEYALESLGPRHRNVSFSGSANFSIGESLHSFAAFGWCDHPSPAVIGSQDAVVAGHMVELINPVCKHPCVVIGEYAHAGTQTNIFRSFGSGHQKNFGVSNRFKSTRVAQTLPLRQQKTLQELLYASRLEPSAPLPYTVLEGVFDPKIARGIPEWLLGCILV